MILSEIRTSTRYITKTDTTTFSDTDLDREANTVYNGLVLEMVQDSGQLNEQGNQAYYNFMASDGLVAGNIGYNGEYPLPTDCLILKRVEAKHTDNLLPVTIYDVSENTASEFEELDNFSSDEPQFRLFRNSMFIRPLPETTVTNGIFLEYIQRQAVLTASDSPVFESNLHDLIPLGTAMRYYLRNPEKFNALVSNEYEKKLQDFRNWYEDKFKKVMSINAKREVW